MLRKRLQGRWYYLYFTDEETEAQRSKIIQLVGFGVKVQTHHIDLLLDNCFIIIALGLYVTVIPILLV